MISDPGVTNFRSISRDTIGIVLAVFDPNLDFFKQQILSIQSQSHSDFLCLVTVNTQSNDRSLFEDQRCFVENITCRDNRFVLLHNCISSGVKENFSYGAGYLALVMPEILYLAFSDQDDLWHPQKLEKKLRLLRTKPFGSLVHCDMRVVNFNGSLVSESCWKTERRDIEAVGIDDLIVRNIVAGAGLLMDMDLWRENPKIPEAIPFHDHWAAFLAANRGGVYAIHEPLYDYRVHGKSTLGVSPFRGIFNQVLTLGSLSKARVKWEEASKRARALWAWGQYKNLNELGPFVRSFDFGFSLFWLALKHLTSGQKAISRSLFGLALGKFLSRGLMLSQKEPSGSFVKNIDQLPQGENTVAIVIAFHPTSRHVENIEMLSKMFSKVIVVDNTPNSKRIDVKDASNITLLKNNNEFGLAGALSRGFCHFLKSCDEEWAVTLDQDSVLDLEFFEVMRQSFQLFSGGDYSTLRPALFSANYRDGNTNRIAVTPPTDAKGFFEQKTLISSGTLLSRSVLETLGSTIQELFIDGIDHDLSLRAQRMGMRSYLSVNVAMTHSLGETKLHRVGFMTCTTSNHGFFRWFFFWRNWGRVTAENFPYSLLWSCSSAWTLVKWQIKHLLFGADRFRILKSSLLGVANTPSYVFAMFSQNPMLRRIPKFVLDRNDAQASFRDALPSELSDATAFCNRLFESLRLSGLWDKEYRVDHVCYRVDSYEKYENLKKKMANFGMLLSEAEVNGRPISTFKLFKPLKVSSGFAIEVLEIPAPKPGRMYADGFEHIEVAVNCSLKLFVEKNADKGLDLSNLHAATNPDVAFAFKEGLVKFHEMTLERVIQEENRGI